MIAEPTHTINQSRVRNLLGKAAGGCGGALNSFLVVLGERSGLYPTGQCSFHLEEPFVRRNALTIAQKRKFDKAADGPADGHGSATPGEDRAMSVQREENAFMTLICHECTAAAVEGAVLEAAEVGIVFMQPRHRWATP